MARQTTARNGKLVGAIQLSDSHEVLLISDGGTLVRTRASEISQVGRNTQGVTLIRLAADESLQAIERVDASQDEDDGDDEVGPVAAPAQQAPPPADCARRWDAQDGPPSRAFPCCGGAPPPQGR